MVDQIGGRPDPRSGIPDLTDVDIDSLPDWQGDPLTVYYEPMETESWALTRCPFVVAMGYFTGLQRVWNMPVLTRGTDVWMSLVPMEVESQWIGIDNASGHTVICGLGMGWSAAMTAFHPLIERVTVVERDPEIIELNRRIGLFDRLPDGLGDKITVVQGDAFEWTPDAPVDLLMPDIWLEVVSDGRADETLRMQQNIGAKGVYFWGQELELARHIVRNGQPINDATLAEQAGKFGLPLIGLDTEDYAENTKTAVKQWMKGRWLEGTNVPDELRSPADDMERR
ncbi:hypothetical protein [Aurantiacibacter marinus]|uniref:hypothetical protein n=1 Tax=Aurantiacibacter marinus TaxID=874156 RepID=UPI00069C34DD|nr:hypothetical protein [Aurantiacibacter marinus]